ncbi:hypothetical protein [Alteromonas sp. ASW11-130]|uniref:hypothetical protein n=1 Tax=Alteromonas sp. ASW11-130 TaxID=3015775 RepID=UPI002241F9A8|nr:hypothetical protein [Alteromonas sp. ASW11-130]MCW8090240.1 hypothetical protein [Alteromonas sp. ASW11-130]
MSNDSRDDDFPRILVDEEDRRAYHQKKQVAAHTIRKDKTGKSKVNNDPGEVRTKGNGIWIFLIALIAVAACGGCYYLYTLLEQQQASAKQAEARIVELENKLSATGEEIGESTVALQVKVTDLSKKTNDLWEQMDKLWASAWRRNQKEIADLVEKTNTIQSSLTSSVKSVNQSVDGHKSQIAALRNEIAAMADEVLALNVRLEQTTGDKARQAQTVKNLTDKLTVLEQRNNALASRISTLENELRTIATKVVSSPSSPGQ